MDSSREDITAAFRIRELSRDGATRAANATGEIHIRGAALMTGYANAEEPAFDPHGWFATGDIGHFDDEGLLHVVDRKTDMVISAGIILNAGKMG